MRFVFVRFFFLRLHSVRVPFSVPRLCLYQFCVPVLFLCHFLLTFFYVFECELFCLYTLFCRCRLPASLPRAFWLRLCLLKYSIAWFSGNDCACVFLLCMGVGPVVCAFGYDCVFWFCVHARILCIWRCLDLFVCAFSRD